MSAFIPVFTDAIRNEKAPVEGEIRFEEMRFAPRDLIALDFIAGLCLDFEILASTTKGASGNPFAECFRRVGDIEVALRQIDGAEKPESC